MITKRAYNSVVLIIQKMERDNLFATPLGRFTSSIIEFLVDQGIITPWKDDRFFVWGDKSKWEGLKKSVDAKFLQGNPTFQQHKFFWDNIDYITTFKLNKYNFVPKEFVNPGDLNRKCDVMIPTDQERKDYLLYKQWEKDCESNNTPVLVDNSKQVETVLT